MHRRYNLAHLILASVVVLGLTPLMVCVDAQARIAFSSERDGKHGNLCDGRRWGESAKTH